jgi:hypothetical protein
MSRLRHLDSETRATELQHTIDAGFVNRRLVETVVGPQGVALIDRDIAAIPSGFQEWERANRIRWIYTGVTLAFCAVNGIRTLRDVLASESGRMFCSTEEVAACRGIYKTDRVTLAIRTPNSRFKVRLEFSTNHISADTLWARLYQGTTVSIIAMFDRKDGEWLTFRPLIIGFPWLTSTDARFGDAAMWWGYTFFENFIEDFDEFSKVRQVAEPRSLDPMRTITEQAFKTCLASLLGDGVSKDWGGETSDYFSAHLHLSGRRVSSAFLLKGPAKFSPMKLNNLGKNNDQICRLAREPADVLFVQHCHEITPPVRETLRAFAVQPSRPRRYCLIDGIDSLRLLQAYGLYEDAIRLSEENRDFRRRKRLPPTASAGDPRVDR